MKVTSLNGLFISTSPPWNPAEDRHGLFQRMEIMLQACVRSWDKLHVLLIDLTEEVRTEEEINSVRQYFTSITRVNVDIEVIKVKTEPSRKNSNFITSYFFPWPLPSLDLRSCNLIFDYINKIQVDLVLCHRITSFRFLVQLRIAKSLKIFLDLDDIEHIAWSRSLRFGKKYISKPLLHLHTLRYWFFQRLALIKCQSVFVCSELDVKKLSKIGAKSSIHAIQNSVRDPNQTESNLFLYPNVFSGILKQHAPPSDSILFVGLIDYAPNRIGLEWFIEKVWPQVLLRKPTARLRVAGRSSEPIRIPPTCRYSIDLLGFVNNLDSLYRASALVICPLLSGGGTRIKLIESAAYGLPSVSTSIGAEGLKFVDRKSILIADDETLFAESILEILDNREFALRLGSAARSSYVEHYERIAVINKISSVLECRY